MIRSIFKVNPLLLIKGTQKYQSHAIRFRIQENLSSHKRASFDQVNRFGFSNTKISRLINPFDKKPVSDKKYISDEDITLKVTRVSEQQKQWKKLEIKKRIELVKKLANSILDDESSLTPVIANQIGKSFKDIKNQFQQLRDVIPLLLTFNIEDLEPQIISQSDSEIVKIIQEPIGIAMIFPHYSEPIFDSMIHLIPCLVSGCGALIKPSDYNHFLGPYLQNKVKQMIGYEIVADLFIEPKDLSKLSQYRSFKKVVYSGSHTSAKHIFQVLTQKRFIDCSMYFGGQDTIYIDQNANIQEAIDEIMKAAFSNNGQAYDSIKRLYVKNKIYNKVLQGLKQKILQLKLGDPKDLSTDQGPLAIPEAASGLEELVNQAISLGAKCQIGGAITTVQSGEGLFFQPTLLTDLTNDMAILSTHYPAPMLCCFQVTSDDDFLSSFNDNRYGAKVKIITQAEPSKQLYKKYEKLINNLEVGSIIINQGSARTSNRRLESWKASTNKRKSCSRSYEQYTIPKLFDI